MDEDAFAIDEDIGYSGVRDTSVDCWLDIVCTLESGREGITERVEDFGVTGRMRPGVRAGVESCSLTFFMVCAGFTDLEGCKCTVEPSLFVDVDAGVAGSLKVASSSEDLLNV